MSTAALVLQGALDVARAPELLRKLPARLTGEVDLSAVKRCDSAGLALLLECRRRSGGKLRLTGVGEQTRNLIDFYQLQPLFD